MRIYKLLLVITLIISFGALAEDMTSEEQMAFIKEKAKKIRRSYWVRGYKDVASSFGLYNKRKFAEHEKNDNNSENPLEYFQYEEIDECLSSRLCVLYRIDVSAEYYGGYGHETYWQLLDIKKRTAQQISQTIYTE